MSTHNIGFYEDLTKIIFELSSKWHLISSAENVLFFLISAGNIDFGYSLEWPHQLNGNKKVVSCIMQTCPCNVYFFHPTFI